MADVTTTANVYQLGGASGVGLANREDLLDLITMISPTETPWFSSVAKGSASATLHEWLEEELKTMTVDAGVAEGAVFAQTTITKPTRKTNFLQIFRNTYEVTGTQEVVSKAGKASEEAWQAMRAMKEHGISIEVGVWGNTTAGAQGDGTVARQLKPINDFIDAGNQIDASAALLTEDTMLNACLELCWNNGGQPDTAFVTGKVKRRITTFMQSSARTINVDGGASADKKLTNTVDIYESDFSTIRIVPDRFLPVTAGTPDTSVVSLLEMGRWRFDFLRRPKTLPIAKVGDSERSMILCEGTVVGLASKSSGEIIGVENDVA